MNDDEEKEEPQFWHACEECDFYLYFGDPESECTFRGADRRYNDEACNHFKERSDDLLVR